MRKYCWDKTADVNGYAKAGLHGKAVKNGAHPGQYNLPCVSPLDRSCIHCIGVTQRDPLSSPCSPPPLALFLCKYKENLVFKLEMAGKVAYTTTSSSDAMLCAYVAMLQLTPGTSMWCMLAKTCGCSYPSASI